jgi:hypothetical protein
MTEENKIMPGEYTGKVTDYGISETKAGMPQVFIKFTFNENGKSLTWFGGLSSDKALDFSGKNLIRCGFRGTDLTVLANGVAANALNTNKDLQLVVENETYEGKTRTKIKFINEIGGVQSKLDVAGAVQKLAGLNIAGRMIQLQQEMGANNGQSNGQNSNEPMQTPGYENGSEPF